MAEANQSVLKVLNWLKAKAESNSVLSMYPIGSVYMTANAEFDPNSEWGGVWVKIENRFLLGSGTKTVGAKGGEENVTLSTSQMPYHSHSRGSMDITGNLANGDIDIGAVSGAIYNRGNGNGAGGGVEGRRGLAPPPIRCKPSTASRHTRAKLSALSCRRQCANECPSLLATFSAGVQFVP